MTNGDLHGRIRGMLLVPETEEIAARGALPITMSATALPKRHVTPPPGFAVDEAYPPIRIEPHPDAAAAIPSHSAIGMAVPPHEQNPGAAHLVRGTIGATQFDDAVEASKLDDGTHRLFADPEIAHLYPLAAPQRLAPPPKLASSSLSTGWLCPWCFWVDGVAFAARAIRKACP